MLDQDFDKTAVFENRISKMASELVEACEEEGIPILLHMIYAAHTEDDEELNAMRKSTTEAHFFCGEAGKMPPAMIAADAAYGNGGIDDSVCKALQRTLIMEREDVKRLGELW